MDPDVDDFVCSAGLDTTILGHDAYAPATRFSHAENTHHNPMVRENDSHRIFTCQELHEPMPEWSFIKLHQSQSGNMFLPQPSNGYPPISSYELFGLYSHKQGDQREKDVERSTVSLWRPLALA